MKGGEEKRKLPCTGLYVIQSILEHQSTKPNCANAELHPVLNEIQQQGHECGHVIQNYLVLILNLKELWQKSNMHEIQTNII
jgi:hypothetical protein